MRIPSFFYAYSSAILIIAMTGTCAHPQANVAETETSTIYVDAQNGSNGNPGTYNSPLQTIQAAVNKANVNNQQWIGTRIIVNAGVYRETVDVTGISKQTTAPLTIQAASNGTAVIAGSDVLTGWEWEAGSPASIYGRSWTYNFGDCAFPSGWPTFPEIGQRTEMIYVNNVPLTQVMAYADMRAGTFYVNEADNVIHIAPPPYTNMSTAVVEAAVRPATIDVSGRSNVVLRGLVFRHAATCINQSGANISSSYNVLVDQVQADWNNWGGLEISSSSNITVQNSIASHNGGVGFQAYKDQNTLYSFDESDFNNWRGAQAAVYNWGMGGTKMMLMRNATVQDHYAYGNQAQGLWFDTDNENITVNKATLAANVLAALQIERNEGPIWVNNSTLCSSGGGVQILTSQQLAFYDNVFYNNGGGFFYNNVGSNKYQAEIYLAGTSGGQWITNWQTLESLRLFTTGTILSGNTFEDASSGQNVFGTYLSGDDWYDFANSINASYNRWYDPYTTAAFKILNGKLVTLAGWQSTMGTDYNSTWGPPSTSPAAACAVPSQSYTDFNVNVDSGSYTMASGKTTAAVQVNSFGYGTVNLSVSGLPSGVSASLSQWQLVSGVASLTLTASKTAANQTVPITLWASDANGRAHNVTFYVQVIHP